MLVAVLYTGQVRTMNNTINYIQNVVRNKDSHLFGVIQADDGNFEHYSSLIHEKINDSVKSLISYDKGAYIPLREELLNNMHIEGNGEFWKNYLRNSGSMIEYNQLYLAFNEMKKYEELNNIRYDYVIRLRTDVVITRTIDFSWLTLTEEQVESKVNRLKEIYPDYSVSRLMNNLLCEERRSFVNRSDLSVEVSDIIDYIKNGRYIISLRKNVFYIVKRELVDDFIDIGIKYGSIKDYAYDNWFDAESQLELFLKRANITYFDSVTEVEGDSLYKYYVCNYFDQEGNLLIRDDVLFFIMRSNL
jgi:hypothetical protein